MERNRIKAGKLLFKSIFMHAWDFADDGVDSILSWIADSRLNTICLAGTYHHGWFIHPHSKKHRAFMTEGDVCYFRPHEEFYKDTKLRPKPSRFVAENDFFQEVSKHLTDDLRLVSWIIGTHNTTFGLNHPELAQQNVYGDILPHGLCPANQDVREYLKAICRDLATNYPLWAVQLESFGWLGFEHDHHHERDLVGLTAMERMLMGLCVCPACDFQASQAGIDMHTIKLSVKKTLDAAFREAPLRPHGHPASMADFENACPEIKKFIEWRKSILHLALKEVKNVSLKGTNCRLLLQTQFEPVLADFADGFSCVAYQKDAEETRNICLYASRLLPPTWNGLSQCLVQLGMGIPTSEDQLRGIITAVRDNGCNGINFYNHSESPPKMLDWLSKIMPTINK